MRSSLSTSADRRNQVLALATAVLSSSPAPHRATLTARQAARVLVGVSGWLSRKLRGGLPAMQATFYELVTYEPAWDPAHPLIHLPMRGDGLVDENVALLAVVASGLIPDFGLENVRCAIAFWATESDPQIWRDVAAA